MTISSIVLLGLLPSLTWLIFYLKEDSRHPEPLSLILYAFVLGGLMTFLALVLQIVLRIYFFDSFFGANHALEIFSFSAVEEILKFLAVFWFISKRKEFDEPLDAMIYMICVALGFAAVENIASLGQAQSAPITGISGIAGIEILALRFFGATLLHSLASAIVGYHWGHAMIHRGKSVKQGIFLGLTIAILLHTIFNYLILLTGPLAWVISFVIFIGFFVLADFERLKDEEKVVEKNHSAQY